MFSCFRERTFTTTRGEVTSMTLSRADVLEDLSRPPMMPAMRHPLRTPRASRVLAQVVPLRRSQGISYDAMCLSQTFPASAYTLRSSCFIFASDRPSFRS